MFRAKLHVISYKIFRSFIFCRHFLEQGDQSCCLVEFCEIYNTFVKMITVFIHVILFLFLPTDSCDRIGASCYLRNSWEAKSGRSSALTCAISPSSRRQSFRDNSDRRHWKRHSPPRSLASAFLTQSSQTRPLPLFFLNDKKICALSRKVTPIKDIYIRQYRTLRTDKQKSRYTGETVETDSNMCLHD